MELGFRTSRKAKIIFAAFIAAMVVCVFAPVIAHADTNYNDLRSEVLDHIEVRTGFNNVIRSASYGILSFLAEGADGIEKGINTILRFKITDIFDGLGLSDGSGYGLSKSLVTVVFTIFLIVGSLTLIIFRSKIKLNDFFIGVLTSAGMIVALPYAISAFDDMRNKGLSDISSVDNAVGAQDKNGIYHSTGVDVLASSVYQVSISAQNNKLTSIAQSNMDNGNILSIDINDVVTDGSLRYKVEKSAPSQSATQQKEFSQLKTGDKFFILGLGADYSRYVSAVSSGNSDVKYYHSASSTAEEMAQRAGMIETDISVPIEQYKEQLMHSACNAIREKLSDFDLDNGIEKVRLNKAQSIDYLISLFNTELQKINTKRNHAIYISESTRGDTTYTFSPLTTGAEYDEMGSFERLGQDIKTTFYPVEYVYRYDFDFLPSFVILIALILALIFAGLKIASVIYDLLFIQLIAGVVIATDQRNSGRAKKMFQELLNSYLIFLLCALMIKLFLKASLYVVNMTDTATFVKLILIIGFAKATIDAPDIIVKILGTDAGVKSGAAAAMSVMSVTRTATGLGRTAVNLSQKGGHAAVAIGKPLAKGGVAAGEKAGSIAAGAIGGTIGGAASAFSSASEFNTAHSTTGVKSGIRTGASLVGGAIGGAIGGAASGGFGGKDKGNAFERGATTGRAFGSYTASTKAGTAIKTGASKFGSGVYNTLRPDHAEKPNGAEQSSVPSQMQQETGSAFNDRAEAPASAPDSGTANRAEAPAPENSRADAPEGRNS